MNNIKKIIILIIVFGIVLTLAIFTYNLGYRKEKQDYIIKEKGQNSEELRNRGYNLILVNNDDNRKTIPNTKLEIKKGSISKNGIILEYNKDEEDKSKIYFDKRYILEKEINGVWYKIGNTLGSRPTNNGDINNIEDDKEYKVVLKFSSLGIIDGIIKGKYRLYSISDNEFNKNRYLKAEFEIKE